MVYRGKPSKACLPCRKRRLLCDLKPAGCASCKRAQIVCYGYRDTASLRISDETSAVQSRINSYTDSSIPRSVTVPVQHRAKDLFYYNYVVGTAQPLDFLQAYYEPHSSEGEHIFRSIDAVSLAYLNFQRRAATTEKEAQKHYAAAIKLTSAAIRSPELVRKDSTILSVLLLDMYEKIANAQTEQSASWAAHINGALALVDLRGEQQYRDPTGLRILSRLSTNIIINCVALNQPIPSELVMLRQTVAASFSKPGDPKWKETNLMLDWVRLQGRIAQGKLSGQAIVDAAEELDNRFVDLARLTETQWQYEIVFVAHKTTHHFLPYHHLYQVEGHAGMWNVLRLSRILLNELICGNCAAEDIKSLYKATSTIVEMVQDICATVPQFINGIGTRRELGNVSKTLPDDLSYYGRALSEDEAQIAHHLPCYRLIYPLYVAAQSVWAPSETKSWVLDQLSFMVEHHAIENAAIVSKFLENGPPKDSWQIYKILGSYAFVC